MVDSSWRRKEIGDGFLNLKHHLAFGCIYILSILEQEREQEEHNVAETPQYGLDDLLSVDPSTTFDVFLSVRIFSKWLMKSIRKHDSLMKSFPV